MQVVHPRELRDYIRIYSKRALVNAFCLAILAGFLYGANQITEAYIESENSLEQMAAPLYVSVVNLLLPAAFMVGVSPLANTRVERGTQGLPSAHRDLSFSSDWAIWRRFTLP